MSNNLIMQLCITNRCNLRCAHCYDESTTLRDMTIKEYETSVEKFLAIAHNWGKHALIWLTGGEPLLHPYFWELIDYLQEKYDSGILLSVYVLTNGLLLDQEAVDHLAAYPVATDVQVSLDGTSKAVHEAIRGKGTYTKTIEALKRLSRSRLTTHIHMVVTKKNFSEAFLLPALGVELDVDVLTVTRLVPVGRGKAMSSLMLTSQEVQDLYLALSEKQDAFERDGFNLEIVRHRCDWPVLFFDPDGLTEEQLMKNGRYCQVGNNHFTVLEDGTVLPCRRLPIPIGNLFHQDLNDILNHPLLWKFRRKHTLMKGKCRTCVFNNDLWRYCSGGASCISYGYYGDPFMPDPQCPFTKYDEVKS